MRGVRTSDLVAVLRPPGPDWPSLLRAAWDAGAAVLPLDPGLPRPERDRILAAARPSVVVDEHGTSRARDGAPVPDGIALAIATSGTTGDAKVALLGHEALTHAVRASLARLRAADAPWLACLPVTHMGGMLVVLRAMTAGAPLAFGPPDPETIGAAGARFTSVVPTVLARCLDANVDLSGYASILVGGDALAPALAARAPNTIQTYGMTESCGGVVYDGVPLDGIEVHVDDDEILLGGPTLFHGYRGDEPHRGWLRTGDAGVVEHGRLRVLGRIDGRITTGGEKVYPQEVEHALRSHPGVAEVIVHGEPDPEWGARVVAIVEPRDPAEPPDPGALIEHLRGHLAAHKVPKEVRLGSVPRTAAGTLDRRG